MAKEIKTKITVEGAKEFKSSLSEAQRGLKVLKSELNAESSAFDKNTSAMVKNLTRGKNLAKQVNEQQKVVALYEKQLQNVVKAYGANSKQAQDFIAKLNNEKAVLNKLSHELDQTGMKATKLGTAFSTISNSVGGLSGLADKAQSALTTFGKYGAVAVAGITTAAVAALKSIYNL